MVIVVISPEADDPRERSVLGALFDAGLERYHLRKPDWSAARAEAWLRALPAGWRDRIVLHGPHPLAPALGLGGVHWKDGAEGLGATAGVGPAGAAGAWRSTSRHELAGLRGAVGRFDSVFYGPVFPSISKRGYGRAQREDEAELGEFLRTRRIGSFTTDADQSGMTHPQRRTQVLAIGGITADRLERCAELGFDGAAVLGAVWSAADPAAAWHGIAAAAAKLERAHHAA
jgi:thiamine-phosphate pyrophosphorylase